MATPITRRVAGCSRAHAEHPVVGEPVDELAIGIKAQPMISPTAPVLQQGAHLVAA